MTPKFLRSEAARFREMAEAVTDREASKQRLLNMAIDYESRAKAADDAQSLVPKPDTEIEPASKPDVESETVPKPDAQAEPAPDVVVRPKVGRRLSLRT
jgi:hypothetical protein